jgi:hypothetical protein
MLARDATGVSSINLAEAWPSSQGKTSLIRPCAGSETPKDFPGKAPACTSRNTLRRRALASRPLSSRICTRYPGNQSERSLSSGAISGRNSAALDPSYPECFRSNAL